MVKHFRFTPVFCAALGAAAGFYFLSSLQLTVSIIILTVFTAVFSFLNVLSFLEKENKTLINAAVCSAVFCCALVIGLCAAYTGKNEIRFSIPQSNITAIEGVLLEDPRIISSGSAVAAVSLVRCADKNVRAGAKGEITVFFPAESAEKIRQFGRGASVFMEGNFRSSGMTFSAVSMHVIKRAPPLQRMRTNVRLSLIKLFDGKNWGGLSLALLLGIKDNLDSNLSAMYRDAGCSYILALSGMHLAILAALIAFLLKKPLGLKVSAVTGALIICMYCFLTGPMPSLNRAVLMYLLGVITILFTLPKDSVSILSLSFLIQIIITPSAGFSVSFILSYLALFGILLIGQPLYSILAGKVPDLILQPLSASCGAFLATAGITGYSFGVIAPVGIFAGLLLVPLTAVFMIGSIIYLALDFFSLSWILSPALSFLYRFMEMTVTAAGNAGGIAAGKPFLILIITLACSVFIYGFEIKYRRMRLKLKPFS